MKDEWIVKVDTFSKWESEDGCYVCSDEKKRTSVVPSSAVIIPRDNDARPPNAILSSEQLYQLLQTSCLLPTD